LVRIVTVAGCRPIANAIYRFIDRTQRHGEPFAGLDNVTKAIWDFHIGFAPAKLLRRRSVKSVKSVICYYVQMVLKEEHSPIAKAYAREKKSAV